MSDLATPARSLPGERMVQIAGRSLRYVIRPGDPDATPLVMFGGIGASLEVLQPLVDCLDDRRTLIRVDVPGIGGSPAGALPYSLPQLAQLIAGGLDELGYPTVDVLGYSWGGALAQQFAVQCGPRCRRLVLISTNTGLFSVPGDPRMMTEMLTPRYLADADAAGRLDEEIKGHRTGPVASAWSAAPNGALGYLHQLAALSCWTSLPFLPFLRRPTLVLSGDADPIVPAANARLLAAAIPHAALQLFPGGHLEIVLAPAGIAARVERFLD